MKENPSSPFTRRNGTTRVMRPSEVMRPIRRGRHILYNSLGILSVIVGTVGIVVPVLPTTVFFIIASGIFITVNPGMYRLLHNNGVTGRYLRVYTSGEGMSRQSKAATIIVLWSTLLLSAWFVRERLWLLLLLALVGIGVSWHVATIKPRMISADKLARHQRIMNGDTNDYRRNV